MRISKASLFFFVSIYNYLYLRLIYFPYFYDNYGYVSYIIIAAICLVIMLVLLLIPKKLYEFNFYDKYKNSKLKNIFNILLFVKIILLVYLGVDVLYNMFFSEYNPFIISIGIIIVVMVIGKIRPSEIIQLNTLFSIASLLCYGFYLYAFIDIDFNLLVKDLSFSFDYRLIILSISLLLDNIIYFITDKKDINFSKAPVVFGVFLAFIVMLFEYLMLVLTSGNTLFLNNEYTGFIALSIEPVSRYNGNFDYIYIILIGVCTVFKSAYYLSIINNSYVNKFKYLNGIYFVLVIAVIWLLSSFKRTMVLTGLLFVGASFVFLLIWMIGVVIKDVKKTKRIN